MRTENISEKSEDIKKYKLQLEKYINDNTADKIIESILLKIDELKKTCNNPNSINTVEIAMETIKGDLINCKPLYLLFNMLFNKRGIHANTKYSKDMIELFLESILFDLFMEKRTSADKDTIRGIQKESGRILEKSLMISIFKDYMTEEDYDDILENKTMYKSTDRGKWMFHLHIVNRVYELTNIEIGEIFSCVCKNSIQEYIQKAYGKNHNINDKDVELIFLIYLADFISKIEKSNINFYKKVEYLYSLREYTNSLYSLFYAMIVDVIEDDTEFRNMIDAYENTSKPKLDIKQQLEKIRKNIKNREKTFKDLSTEDFLLTALEMCTEKEDKDIPVRVYFNSLLDTVEEWDSEKQEKKIRRDFDKITYSTKEFPEIYKVFRIFLPKNCLYIEEHLRKQILYLIKNLNKDMNTSREKYIYSICCSVYLDAKIVFEYLSLFNSTCRIPNHNIWDAMRCELSQVLLSKIEWESEEITLIDFLQTGLIRFLYWSNYYQTAKFQSVNATGFIPYLQSLTISYNFVDADETVQLIINILNQLVDYVRNIVIGLYDRGKKVDDKTLSSLIYNGINSYFKNSEINGIQQKLFIQWDTRTSHGCIFSEEIRQLLTARKNLIKKIL